MKPIATFINAIAFLFIASQNVYCQTLLSDQYASIGVKNSEYVVQNNRYGANTAQIISVDVSQGSFQIVSSGHNNATNGVPGGYPSIFKGCHWVNCSTFGNNLPIKISDLYSVPLVWNTSTTCGTTVCTGTWNTALDIWFNKTRSTSGQPDGAELMVWLSYQGNISPKGINRGTTSIAGVDWDVWTGTGSETNGDKTVTWQIISYVRTSQTSSVNFDAKAFIDHAVNIGSISREWYLIDLEAGFEIWSGGEGLLSNAFSVTPVETICGASNGKTFLSKPNAFLCLNDNIASPIIGSGPWSWSCQRTVGQPQSCSADLASTDPTYLLPAESLMYIDWHKDYNLKINGVDYGSFSEAVYDITLPQIRNISAVRAQNGDQWNHVISARIEAADNNGVFSDVFNGVINYGSNVEIPFNKSVVSKKLRVHLLDTLYRTGFVIDALFVVNGAVIINVPVSAGGTVTDSTTFSCNSHCSSSFPVGTSLILTAIPTQYYLFSGWSGGCTGGATRCILTLDSAENIVNADFTLDRTHSVLIGTANYYSSILDAYQVSATGETIKAWAIGFTGSLTFNSQKEIKLLGGYNNEYNNVNGMTKIEGGLTIQQGKVKIDHVVVK